MNETVNYFFVPVIVHQEMLIDNNFRKLFTYGYTKSKFKIKKNKN
jgi:hypothetical protein